MAYIKNYKDVNKIYNKIENNNLLITPNIFICKFMFVNNYRNNYNYSL